MSHNFVAQYTDCFDLDSIEFAEKKAETETKENGKDTVDFLYSYFEHAFLFSEAHEPIDAYFYRHYQSERDVLTPPPEMI